MSDLESSAVNPSHLLCGGAAFVLLYLGSLYNYLLFHSLVEIFSVIVACGIFIIGWNSRRFLNNNYFLFVGIAFIFVGAVDLIHTFAYKGMGIFPEYGPNLATQLWIVGRFLQSFALLIAPIFLIRKLRERLALALFLAITALLLTAVFSGAFPDCFVEGKGLTPFKKGSEYLISFMLAGALFTLRRKQHYFDRQVVRLISVAIALFIAAELAFTLYTDVYGISNMAGHFLKLAGFFLMYKALIETGLVRPYDLLFRELKESEGKYRALFENMVGGFALHKVVVDETGKPVDYVYLEINSAFEKLTGLKAENILNKQVTQVLPDIEKDPADWIGVYGKVALTGEELRFEQYSDLPGKWYSVIVYSPMRNYFATVFEDITERKIAEEKLQKAYDELELRVLDRTKELSNVHDMAKAERQRLYGVLETLPVYVVLMTQDYHVPFSNRFFRERFGESGGRRCYEYLFNRSEPCETCESFSVLKTNAPHHWEWTGPDGRNYDIHDYPFTDSDGSTLILEMGIDVTEQKQAEKALEEVNETLEHRISERTIELQAVNSKLLDSRRAALNMMEDADIARRRAEEINGTLLREIIDRKRAEEALRESEQRINILAQTAGSLLASDSPQQVVESLCQRVMEFLDCHTFFNFLVDEEECRLHLNACAGIPEEEKEKIQWLDFGVAVCGCAARDAQRIVAEDIPNTPDPRTELIKSYGIRAYACHPLMVKERVLGTISFGTRSRDSFRDEELALMKAVADQVAIAMERKQAEEALRRAHDELELRVTERTKELAMTVETLLGEMAEREKAEGSLQRLNRLYAVLSETDQAIVRAFDKEALFRDFCKIAVEQGGFILSWVGLVDEASGRVNIVAASGATAYLDDIRITAGEEPAGEGPTGISIREGSYFICNDFLNDPCTTPWHERGLAHGICASASVALKEEGRVIGALTLYAGVKDFFDQQHVDLLKQIGADVSFALDNFTREERRRKTEQALREETLERLRAVEALREKDQLLLQQSRLAAMGEMINNIAHQWRQPLNVLGLNVQRTMLFYEMGDFNKEFLQTSTDDAMKLIRHMSQTIDDFRNFFKTDKDKTCFSVTQAVQWTISLLRDGLDSDHIGIVTRDDGDAHINGYFNEFCQVLLNIVQNARDVIVERNITAGTVTIASTVENGKTVITITDNAGGIPEEIIDRIYEPYFSTKGVQGTGIGLFMSKNIIETNMAGSITVRNTDQGAQFRIEI